MHVWQTARPLYPGPALNPDPGAASILSSPPPLPPMLCLPFPYPSDLGSSCSEPAKDTFLLAVCERCNTGVIPSALSGHIGELVL